MLFYADHSRVLEPLEVGGRVADALLGIASCYRRAYASPYRAALETHADLVGAAILLSEVHQAVADQLNPTMDDVRPETESLASAGLLLGRSICRSACLLREGNRSEANGLPELLESAASSARAAAGAWGEGRLRAKVPEGYAFYSLYPEMYLASLRRALATEPRRGAYVAIGIRSIGTSLAAAVAGALLEGGLIARVETVRPRGHPFDRYLDLSPALQRRLQEAARAGSGFLVADEGPGLTCSSFLSVCAALEKLGVERERILLLSAWQGKPSIYASEDHRAQWGSARVFHTPAQEAFDGWRALLPFVLQATGGHPPRGNGHLPPLRADIEDLSYGRWRQRCYPTPDRWPTVHRSLERTKLLTRFQSPLPLGEGVPLLAKFAGLGDYGREKYERALVLAEAGFGPPVAGLAYGFLLHPFIGSLRPMSAGELSPALMARMVDYYAFIARRFSRPPAGRFESLAEILTLNTKEGLGLDLSPFVAAWRSAQHPIDRLPLVRLDGKPQPYEWLAGTAAGLPTFLKADSADHFLDHTMVGEQSILWDLAGACEEWGMAKDQICCFLALWERQTGDSQAAALLDFYRAVYLAFRLAAMHYAVHSTDEEDVRRSLLQEQWKYGQRLRELVGHQPSSVGDTPTR